MTSALAALALADEPDGRATHDHLFRTRSVPVFVDASGRRRSRLQLAVVGAALACGGFLTTIGVGFTGPLIGPGLLSWAEAATKPAVARAVAPTVVRPAPGPARAGGARGPSPTASGPSVLPGVAGRVGTGAHWSPASSSGAEARPLGRPGGVRSVPATAATATAARSAAASAPAAAPARATSASSSTGKAVGATGPASTAKPGGARTGTGGTSAKAERTSARTAPHAQAKAAKTAAHTQAKAAKTAAHTQAKAAKTAAHAQAKAAKTAAHAQAKIVISAAKKPTH